MSKESKLPKETTQMLESLKGMLTPQTSVLQWHATGGDGKAASFDTKCTELSGQKWNVHTKLLFKDHQPEVCDVSFDPNPKSVDECVHRAMTHMFHREKAFCHFLAHAAQTNLAVSDLLAAWNKWTSDTKIEVTIR